MRCGWKRNSGSEFRVRVAFRPALPLAVRDPAFFSPDNLKRAKYIRIDWPRRAELLGIPHVWPSPDPIVQEMQTYKIAADQPHIYRLTYLGVEAERRGRGLPFAYEVSHLILGGTRDWHLGDHLARAAQWGVPTFAFENEPLFGEDRIDTLRWRLGKHALQRV